MARVQKYLNWGPGILGWLGRSLELHFAADKLDQLLLVRGLLGVGQGRGEPENLGPSFGPRRGNSLARVRIPAPVSSGSLRGKVDQESFGRALRPTSLHPDQSRSGHGGSKKNPEPKSNEFSGVPGKKNCSTDFKTNRFCDSATPTFKFNISKANIKTILECLISLFRFIQYKNIITNSNGLY